MNRLKDSLTDLRGITPTPGKFVCPNCFTDDALRDVVRANATSKICSYCGRKSSKAIAAKLDDVAEHVLFCIEERYEDAANGVGWEDGQYVGAETWDTWDLISDEVEVSATSEDLLSDLTNAVPAQTWSRIDPYGPLERDVMNWSWKDFCETVKHSRRFFFHEPTSTGAQREQISPLELLSSVAAGCVSYGLVSTLKPGQRLYRCRVRKKTQKFTDPVDLGSPPASRASQSRMSPAGISMFYGAFDQTTAAAETLVAPSRHAMAEFRTTRPIRILNLVRPPVVSIFDRKLGGLDEWASFMRGFIKDLQRPVSIDGEQHYEYVPTQIVSEFFRYGAGATGKLDGLMYGSVKNPGGQCIVLFADSSEIDPTPDPSPTPAGKRLLKLRKVFNKRR